MLYIIKNTRYKSTINELFEANYTSKNFVYGKHFFDLVWNEVSIIAYEDYTKFKSIIVALLDAKFLVHHWLMDINQNQENKLFDEEKAVTS